MFCFIEKMIIDHTHPKWIEKQEKLGIQKHNGAYYYSQEIVQNIIPHIKTERNWLTVNVTGECTDSSIVFIHSNVNTRRIYKWLENYKDLILICGVPETVNKVRNLGRAFYLPLSIDTEYVKQFRTTHDKQVAYAGRESKSNGVPSSVPKLHNLPREELLKEMAHYKQIFAVGRTALEAICLGAEILAYDPRYPDVERWQLLDNRDVIPRLQTIIDMADE